MRKLITILFLILCSSFLVFSTALTEKSINRSDRIISLAPNITEIIFALGKGDNLVGRTNVCDYPSSVLDVEDVGEMYTPSIEKIVSLKPDVVFATNLTSEDTIQALRNAKISVSVLEYQESLNGTYDLIENISKIVNAEDKASKIISEMKDKIERISSVVSQIPEDKKKSCIYMVSWGEFGDWCATGETYLGEILEVAGGINSARNSSNWYISRETLLKENPDVIFLSYYDYMSEGADNFKNTEPYSFLTGTVIKIDGQRAERQGVRTAETVEEIAKALYPELF